MNPRLKIKQKILHAGFGSSIFKFCASCVVGAAPFSFAVESMTNGNIKLLRDTYLINTVQVAEEDMKEYYQDYKNAVIYKKPFLRDQDVLFKDKYYA